MSGPACRAARSARRIRQPADAAVALRRQSAEWIKHVAGADRAEQPRHQGRRSQGQGRASSPSAATSTTSARTATSSSTRRSPRPSRRVAAGVLRVARRHRGQHRAPRVAVHVPARRVDARMFLLLFVGLTVMWDLRLLGLALHQRAGVGDERSPAAVGARRLRRDGGHRRPAVLRHSRPHLSKRVVSRQGHLPDPGDDQHLVLPLRASIRTSRRGTPTRGCRGRRAAPGWPR